jgi:hypothetical protein
LGKANARQNFQIAREANLRLGGREARLAAPSAEETQGQNAWAALCAANEKVGQFSESQILVCLYNTARTHFIRNS